MQKLAVLLSQIYMYIFPTEFHNACHTSVRVPLLSCDTLAFLVLTPQSAGAAVVGAVRLACAPSSLLISGISESWYFLSQPIRPVTGAQQMLWRLSAALTWKAACLCLCFCLCCCLPHISPWWVPHENNLPFLHPFFFPSSSWFWEQHSSMGPLPGPFHHITPQPHPAAPSCFCLRSISPPLGKSDTTYYLQLPVNQHFSPASHNYSWHSLFLGG